MAAEVNPAFVAFLRDLMRRRGLALTPLAAEMGFTHPSLVRRLRGEEKRPAHDRARG